MPVLRLPIILFLILTTGLLDWVLPPSSGARFPAASISRAFHPQAELFSKASGGAGRLDSIFLVPFLVQLGEAQHGDGATFERKTAWIQRLHEKFGFDVLLFESGIWAGVDLDRSLRRQATTPNDIGRYVWQFWAKAEETSALWPYLAKENITVGGFDPQFTGARKDVLAQLGRIAGKAGCRDSCWQHTRRWLGKLEIAGLNGYHANPEEPEKTRIKSEINALLDALEPGKNPYDAYDCQLLRNFLWNLEYWALPDNARNPFRDSIMALNILYLQKNVFPGKKIMVWAANAHIVHPAPSDDLFPFKTMGDYIHEHLGNKCYTLLLSSHHGQTRNIYNKSLVHLYDAGKASLEYQLAESGFGEGLVDLQQLAGAPPFKLRALGHGNHLARWARVADAVYFIPKMTPYHPL